MAYGRACIANPVAARGLGVVHGDQLMLAERADDWVESVQALRDRDFAVELSGRARAFVEKRHGPTEGLERVRGAMEPVLARMEEAGA